MKGLRGWRRSGLALGGVAALILLLWGLPLGLAPAYRICVEGQGCRTHRSRLRHPRGILAEAGLSPVPPDRIEAEGRTIRVRPAAWAWVQADGRRTGVRILDPEPGLALAAAGVRLGPGDRVTWRQGGDDPVDPPAPDPAPSLPPLLEALLDLRSPFRTPPPPLPPAASLEVTVRRAIPFWLEEAGVRTPLSAPAATVGEALAALGIPLYPEDRLSPAPETPLVAGMTVRIERARPVAIWADGRLRRLRTRGRTVADALAAAGLTLGPRDLVTPALTTPLAYGTGIRVVRVREDVQVVEEPIPYRVLWRPDPELEIDRRRVEPGRPGRLRRRIHTLYHDGRIVRTWEDPPEVVEEPKPEVHYYGTKIVLRTVETPDGPVTYWRKLWVLATSYYPSTSGKAPDDPTYGITYTGVRATRGIVAVDPKVIPLHTRMYVPGYGFAQAEDTGGLIRGMHIDLAFDDEDRGKGLWSRRWVMIYLLPPVPPPDQIRWILPDWPPGPPPPGE